MRAGLELQLLILHNLLQAIIALVGGSGGFAAVDGGFGAPLEAEDGEGFEDGFGEAEEVDEDGAVEGLAGRVVVGLVGGEELVVLEVGEELVGVVDLLVAEFSSVEGQEIRQLGNGHD